MLRVFVGVQRVVRGSSRMFSAINASVMSPAPAPRRRTLIAPRWRCLSSAATDASNAAGDDKTKLTVAGTVARKQSSNELVLQAIELSKRGTNSRSVGLLAEAVALFESAVDCAERGLPTNDADLFLFYEQLADAYGRVTDFGAAERVGLKSLRLLEKLADDTVNAVSLPAGASAGGGVTLEELQQLQLQLARTQRNVAIACEMQAKLALAESLFRQSLAMLQYIHPRRMRAKALERQQRAQYLQPAAAAPAVPAASEADDATSTRLLPTGPGAQGVREDVLQREYDADMAAVLHHLGMCIDKQTDAEATVAVAAAAVGSASESASASASASTPALATTAHITGSTPRRTEAERLLRLAIAIREKLGGLDHASCALALHDLAVNLQSQRRDLEAECMFRRAVHVRKDEKDKDDNPTYLMTLHNLGEVYFQQGAFKLADTLLRKVGVLRKKKFGAESLMYAATLERHAEVIERHTPAALAEDGDAQTYHARAAEMRQQAATIRATVEATRAAEASKARDKAAAEQKMLDSDSTSDGFKAAAAAAAAHKPTAATS